MGNLIDSKQERNKVINHNLSLFNAFKWFFLRILSISLMKQFQITKKKKRNSKLTHPLFLNSISMSRLENTWLSAHRLHCEEKRRSCQCSAFEEPIHVINCVPCMQFRLHV
jgi:hypothetical protein